MPTLSYTLRRYACPHVSSATFSGYDQALGLIHTHHVHEPSRKSPSHHKHGRSMPPFAVVACAAVALSTSPKVALQGIFSRAPDAVLADPVNKQPLTTEVVVIGAETRARRVSASGVVYPSRSRVYADLLPSSGRASPLSVSELQDELRDAWSTRVQTGLFRSPLTSFLYERGWRAGFANAGFPGIEKEFEEVQDFFAPVAASGTVVDMSCGSGLMTRRLLRSGAYERVLALDYSESMLLETARRVREEKIASERLTLCRADVAALPLAPASIDALHAGAAMHCWPKLEEGLVQIRQALKPGGRFFATTFLQGAYGNGMPQQSGVGGASFRFFADEDELTKLCVEAGFVDVTVRREGRGCAVIRAEAPAVVAEEAEPEAAVAEPEVEVMDVAAAVEKME